MHLNSEEVCLCVCVCAPVCVDKQAKEREGDGRGVVEPNMDEPHGEGREKFELDGERSVVEPDVDEQREEDHVELKQDVERGVVEQDMGDRETTSETNEGVEERIEYEEHSNYAGLVGGVVEEIEDIARRERLRR